MCMCVYCRRSISKFSSIYFLLAKETISPFQQIPKARFSYYCHQPAVIFNSRANIAMLAVESPPLSVSSASEFRERL